MNVVVSLGNMFLPARVVAQEEERLTVTIKYSKLAVELDLVSVTMSLPPSRVEFEEAPVSFPELKASTPQDSVHSIDEIVPQASQVPETECLKPESPKHSVTVSACSGASSRSSDWYDDIEEEKRNSGEVNFAAIEEEESRLLPEHCFHFNDLFEAVRDGLANALDAQPFVEGIIFEMLALDPKLFDTSVIDLGFSPLTNEMCWSMLYRAYTWQNGVKVYRRNYGYSSPDSLTQLFPTYMAEFDLETNMVSIMGPDDSHIEPPLVRWAMVSSGEDYCVHIYKDIHDPIVEDLLMNWRAPAFKQQESSVDPNGLLDASS
jgi:hypothetical protein